MFDPYINRKGMWIIYEHIKNFIVTGIEEGVDHLANAVVICGNSQQLMQVFSQTLPPPVVQMLMMRIPVVKQVTTTLMAVLFYHMNLSC